MPITRNWHEVRRPSTLPHDAARSRHGCSEEVELLEFLPAPEAVLAMRASGTINEEDIERAIKEIEDALARHSRIALFAEVEISGMTPGAFARDVSYGLSKLRDLARFHRVAVVTSQDWISRMVWLQSRILPRIELRCFAPAEREEALAWVSRPPEEPSTTEPGSTQPSIREIETDRPDVLAFEVNGRIRREDLSGLIPVVEQALAAHEHIRILVRITRFDGVGLDALRAEGLAPMKVRGLRQVERYALVGGPDWMRTVVHRVAPWVGIDTRYFEPSEEAAAWDWLKEGSAATQEITPAFLDAFAAAWNRHDVDAILSMMTPDCVFEASHGPEVKGTVYVGQEEARRGIEEVFATFPDAQWNRLKALPCG